MYTPAYYIGRDCSFQFDSQQYNVPINYLFFETLEEVNEQSRKQEWEKKHDKDHDIMDEGRDLLKLE